MKEMTKRLYAIAAKLGLVEGGEDAFHQIVYRVTGKAHVSELDEAEGKAVKQELLRMKGQMQPKLKQYEEVPGMMSAAQQRYAWRLIYRLIDLDGDAAGAAPGERLAGAVRKTLGTTANPRSPLRWVSREEGSKLIEALKRYVKSAEKKSAG